MAQITQNPIISPLPQSGGAPGVYYLADGSAIFGCIGDPEGAIAAGVRSLAIDESGNVYVKASGSGNTGWQAVGGGGGGGGITIGDPVTGGTVNSILYIGAGGLLAQENANFSYNENNNAFAVIENGGGSAIETGGYPALGCFQTVNADTLWNIAITNTASPYNYNIAVLDEGSLVLNVFDTSDVFTGEILFSPFGGLNLYDPQIVSTYYGSLFTVDSDVFALGYTPSIINKAAYVDLITWGPRGVTQYVPTTAIANGDLPISVLHFYLDETSNTVKFKAKESGGTVLTGSLGGAVEIDEEYVPYRPLGSSSWETSPIRVTNPQTIFVTDGVTNFVSIGNGGLQVYQNGSSTFPIININSKGGLYGGTGDSVFVAAGGDGIMAVTDSGVCVGFVDQFSYYGLHVKPVGDGYPACRITSFDTTTQEIFQVVHKIAANDNVVFSITNRDAIYSKPQATVSSPVNGDIWIDTTRNALATRISGLNYFAGTALYRAIDDKTIANTTTETTLFAASSIGTLTIPANVLTVGKTIVLKAKGYWNTDGTGSSFNIRVKIGSVTVATGAITPAVSIVTLPWEIDIVMTVRSVGASGSIMIAGNFKNIQDGSARAAYMWDLNAGAAGTIDTTGTLAIDLTAQMGAAAADNYIVCTTSLIELVG